MGLFKNLLSVGPKLSQDREFLFKTLRQDIPEIVPKIVPKERHNDIGKMELSNVIMSMMEYYADNGKANVFNTFENVITYFYKYDPDTKGSLFRAVDLLAEDFARYMKEN